jgi:7-cyano-7-deazaguanine synthase
LKPAQKKPARAVVLLSGGMDSALVLALARQQGRECHALSLDYGQCHARELRSARQQASIQGCASHRVLRLPLKQVAQGALLTPGAKGLATAKGRKPAAYVSFRNGVFLSLAFSLAEALGAKEVWGGWCETDAAGYPDCRPSFLEAFAKAAALGTRAGEARRAVALRSPLTGLDKAAIIRQGAGLGLDFSRTHTCYAGASRPCGACDACRLRAQGFKAAGMTDPLIKPCPKNKKKKRKP